MMAANPSAQASAASNIGIELVAAADGEAAAAGCGSVAGCGVAGDAAFVSVAVVSLTSNDDFSSGEFVAGGCVSQFVARGGCCAAAS